MLAGDTFTGVFVCFFSQCIFLVLLCSMRGLRVDPGTEFMSPAESAKP